MDMYVVKLNTAMRIIISKFRDEDKNRVSFSYL